MIEATKTTTRTNSNKTNNGIHQLCKAKKVDEDLAGASRRKGDVKCKSGKFVLKDPPTVVNKASSRSEEKIVTNRFNERPSDRFVGRNINFFDKPVVNFSETKALDANISSPKYNKKIIGDAKSARLKYVASIVAKIDSCQRDNKIDNIHNKKTVNVVAEKTATGVREAFAAESASYDDDTNFTSSVKISEQKLNSDFCGSKNSISCRISEPPNLFETFSDPAASTFLKDNDSPHVVESSCAVDTGDTVDIIKEPLPSASKISEIHENPSLHEFHLSERDSFEKAPMFLLPLLSQSKTSSNLEESDSCDTSVSSDSSDESQSFNDTEADSNSDESEDAFESQKSKLNCHIDNVDTNSVKNHVELSETQTNSDAIAASHGFYKWNSSYKKVLADEARESLKHSNISSLNETFISHLTEASAAEFSDEGMPITESNESVLASPGGTRNNLASSSSSSTLTELSSNLANNKVECESSLCCPLDDSASQTKCLATIEFLDLNYDLNLTNAANLSSESSAELWSNIIKTDPLNLPSESSTGSCSEVTSIEPLNLCSTTSSESDLREEKKEDSDGESSAENLRGSYRPPADFQKSLYEYKPGSISAGNDWSSLCIDPQIFKVSNDHEFIPHDRDIEKDGKMEGDENHENVKKNLSCLESDSESDISESNVYYKYRDEELEIIKKTYGKVRQRLTKKGIKKRQRIFPDKHGLHYNGMKFHKSYRTTTFSPSNVNRYLEQFIPTIVDQRKICTAKRLKQRKDTLDDIYMVPKSGKIQFGDTEIIKFDKEEKIVPLVNANNSKDRKIEEKKSILKTTKKESPIDWDTLVGDDTVKFNLARIFNICNIPLESLTDSMEAILEKIAAAIIVECGNKEYCNNYQSLYDEIKFEEHIKTMKIKTKELKKLLEESIEENRTCTKQFTERLNAAEAKSSSQRQEFEAALETQRKEYEEILLRERTEFNTQNEENFEDFEGILAKENKANQDLLAEQRKEYEEKLNKEREDFQDSLERECAKHTCILSKERQEHSQTIHEMRKECEASLTQEREKITRMEKFQTNLFNSAVEEYRVRERIAADHAACMEAEVERQHNENLASQVEIETISKENAKLKELMKKEYEISLGLRPELDSLKRLLSKQDEWKDRYKEKYISVCENLSYEKKELKVLSDKNNLMLKENKALKDTISELKSNISESKEVIDDCKDFIEGIQSHIKHCKLAFIDLDKEYAKLNENFLKIANAHFPLQDAYRNLLATHSLLQKEHQEVCKENERKARDIKRANEQMIKAGEKVKQARKSAKGDLIYITENDDENDTVLQMPLDFLKDKELVPLPNPIPFIESDPKCFPHPELIPTPVDNPNQCSTNGTHCFPTEKLACGSPSKRGSKRKIFRSLANKMSLSHNHYEKSIHIIA